MELDPKDTLLVEFEPAATDGAIGKTSADDLEEPVLVAQDSETWRLNRIPGVVIGTLVAWNETGHPLVDFPGNPWDCFLVARSTVPLCQTAIGRDVALMFVEGDPRQPLVIGLIQPPNVVSRAEGQRPLAVEVDGERLVFCAEQEIVFRCGKASLTLTRAGKVLIRGTYLLSRSSGVNRIKGGSVQIN
jgi:hypothetical protein